MRTPPRLLVLFAVAVLVVVAVIAALGTDTWWLLPVAFMVFIGAAVLTLLPLSKALTRVRSPTR